MKQESVIELVGDQLLPLFKQDQERNKTIKRCLRYGGEKPVLPRKASREHKALADLALTPWLEVVSQVSLQGLNMEYVNSRTKSRDNLEQFFSPWDRNGMDVKQSALYKSANDYGLAYARVLRGDTGSVIRTFAPTQMLAVYGDVAHDEFPMFAMEVVPSGKSGLSLVLTDEECDFYLSADSSGGLQFLEERPHGEGFIPIVRYSEFLDTEGNSVGEIERLITTAGRINKTVYDRLLVQHFNSWKVRTATGIDDSGMSDEDTERMKLKLSQDDILTGTEGMTFGTLAETSIEPFIKGQESDLEDLAAVSQTPLSSIGKMVNVGDQGIAEARAGWRAKTRLRQTSYGASNVSVLRIAAQMESRNADAEDFTVKGRWADLEEATVSQAVDALGKAANMLGVPAEMLWDRIPGVDPTEAKSWRAYAEEHPSADMVEAQALAGQLQAAP